jgi:hypothetical protein
MERDGNSASVLTAEAGGLTVIVPEPAVDVVLAGILAGREATALEVRQWIRPLRVAAARARGVPVYPVPLACRQRVRPRFFLSYIAV